MRTPRAAPSLACTTALTMARRSSEALAVAASCSCAQALLLLGACMAAHTAHRRSIERAARRWACCSGGGRAYSAMALQQRSDGTVPALLQQPALRQPAAAGPGAAPLPLPASNDLKQAARTQPEARGGIRCHAKQRAPRALPHLSSRTATRFSDSPSPPCAQRRREFAFTACAPSFLQTRFQRPRVNGFSG